MTPNIIQETSQGLSHIPLQDALFREREIYCIGEITREYVHALVMQLRWLQHDSPSAEITLYIDSPGGEVGSGLALYDVMQAIQCPIRTVCANAASMAEILARHTGHTIAEVYAKTATDTYFDATEAVAWGLADRIVTTL